MRCDGLVLVSALFAKVLKLGRRQVAEAGMQPRLVINVFQKVADLCFEIGKIVVPAQVYLFALQGFHKAFGFGVGVSFAAGVLFGAC